MYVFVKKRDFKIEIPKIQVKWLFYSYLECLLVGSHHIYDVLLEKTTHHIYDVSSFIKRAARIYDPRRKIESNNKVAKII